MSQPGGQQTAPETGGWRFARLPAWLRPRDAELPGRGQLRLVETTLLLLVALVLATATIYDLARQTRINGRLSADLLTWRLYTREDDIHYSDLSVDQATLGLTSEREVVCGNTLPGMPGDTTQICLEIWGTVHHGLRAVHGGWYLPPRTPDEPKARYGCFGAAPSEGICPR